MNLFVIKTFFCLIFMIALVIMAFITKDIVYSQLFSSLGIIIVALTSKLVSTPKNRTDEKF